MTRGKEVLALADRLRALQGDFDQLGLSVSSGVHGLDRATFDAIPGKEDYFPANAGRPAFWSKRHNELAYFTNQPPAGSVRESFGRPRERVF